MFVDFGLAQERGGGCYLRYDDTNPEAEKQEYIDHIQEIVGWLGWKPWKVRRQPNLPFCIRFARRMEPYIVGDSFYVPLARTILGSFHCLLCELKRGQQVRGKFSRLTNHIAKAAFIWNSLQFLTALQSCS